MEKVYLATYDEEDDLYSGFNEFHPTLNTSSLIQDTTMRDVKNQQQSLQVIRSARCSKVIIHTNADLGHLFRHPSVTFIPRYLSFYYFLIDKGNATRANFDVKFVDQQSRGIVTRGALMNTARPVTAVKGAGYTSNRGATGNQVYDPLHQSVRMTASLAEPKATDQWALAWNSYYIWILSVVIFKGPRSRSKSWKVTFMKWSKSQFLVRVKESIVPRWTRLKRPSTRRKVCSARKNKPGWTTWITIWLS